MAMVLRHIHICPSCEQAWNCVCWTCDRELEDICSFCIQEEKDPKRTGDSTGMNADFNPLQIVGSLFHRFIALLSTDRYSRIRHGSRQRTMASHS